MRTSKIDTTDRKVITMALMSLVMFLGLQSKAAAATSSTAQPATQKSTISSSQDLMCRNQAKEVAAQIYKDCVVEARQAELDRIKQEYKDELTQIQNKYNKKLQSLKETTPSSSPKPLAGASKEKSNKSQADTTLLTNDKRSENLTETIEIPVQSK